MTEPLTARSVAVAIIAGALVGPVLAAANIYMGLKAGFTSDGSIVAAIVAVALVRVLGELLPFSFSERHTNLVQTAASAGAFAAVAGLTNAVPAMALDGVTTSPWLLGPWVFCLSTLGICLAVPLRRRAIEVEKLRFPSGVACAEAIKALHTKAGEARRGAVALLWAFGIAGLFTWIRDAGLPLAGKLVPSKLALPGSLGQVPCANLSLGVAFYPALIGIGALIGLRGALSLALGSTLGFAVAGPWLHGLGVIEVTSYRDVQSWTVWPAVGMLVGGAFGMLLGQAGLIRRSIGLLSRSEMDEKHPPSALVGQVPRTWWMSGLVLATAGSAVVAKLAFGVQLWQSVVAVVVAMPLAAVAIRAVGETDLSPSNNLAKVSQFIFAGLAPGQTVANVAAAGVTSGCAIEATEVMTDLKAGSMLGNSPRTQFIAQLVGVAVAAGGAVAAYSLLTAAFPLGSEDLPAPTARAWATLAAGLAGESNALPSGAVSAAWIAGALGLVMSIISSRWKELPLPSAVAIGLGPFFPASFSATILIGALAAAGAKRAAPGWWIRYQHLLPSGLIVGESLVGLLVAALQLLGAIS